MPPSQPLRDLATEAAKTVPPLTILAITLNEWLALVSIVYVIAQLAYLLRKWVREEEQRRAA